MIFDTHSHYEDDAFAQDRHELLLSLKEKEIGWIVDVGSDMKTSHEAVELAKQYEFAYAAVGVHPSEVEELSEQDMQVLSDLCACDKVVAVGEIGYDFHWPEPGREIQKKWFCRQIELAKQVNLPIIIHSRDAAEPTMQLIRETKAYDCGGVIHCYSYSKEQAKEYVDMGFYIGVGGVVTFKNAKKLHQTVEAIPLEHLVLETDCPYMSPEPYRGNRNDSTKLHYVAQRIAEIKGITKEEVVNITTANAKKMYRLQ